MAAGGEVAARAARASARFCRAAAVQLLAIEPELAPGLNVLPLGGLELARVITFFSRALHASLPPRLEELPLGGLLRQREHRAVARVGGRQRGLDIVDLVLRWRPGQPPRPPPRPPPGGAACAGFKFSALAGNCEYDAAMCRRARPST